MDLLDLPAPLFEHFDGLLASLLPPALRLAVWAVAAAALSVELYKLLSPQQRIAAAKLEIRDAQAALNSYDGEFEGAWPLMRRLLSAAGRRLALVLPASLAAALPLLCLLVWLERTYGLPGLEFLPFGPDWLRAWFTLFFAVLIVTALVLQRLRRVA